MKLAFFLNQERETVHLEWNPALFAIAGRKE
jgi:hypothetical protein